MKKEILLPLAILTAVLAFTLWNGAAMAQNITRWHGQLRQADALAQTKDWARVMDVLQASYDDWSQRQTWLHIVAKHDAVDDAETMYHRAMAFAAEEEPSEFRAELADLQNQLHLLAELEQFSLENIL